MRNANLNKLIQQSENAKKEVALQQHNMKYNNVLKHILSDTNLENGGTYILNGATIKFKSKCVAIVNANNNGRKISKVSLNAKNVKKENASWHCHPKKDIFGWWPSYEDMIWVGKSEKPHVLVTKHGVWVMSKTDQMDMEILKQTSNSMNQYLFASNDILIRLSGLDFKNKLNEILNTIYTHIIRDLNTWGLKTIFLYQPTEKQIVNTIKNISR